MRSSIKMLASHQGLRLWSSRLRRHSRVQGHMLHQEERRGLQGLGLPLQGRCRLAGSWLCMQLQQWRAGQGRGQGLREGQPTVEQLRSKQWLPHPTQHRHLSMRLLQRRTSHVQQHSQHQEQGQVLGQGQELGQGQQLGVQRWGKKACQPMHVCCS